MAAGIEYPMVPSQPDLITTNKILVHIDVDPAEIGKNVGPTIPLVGDAKHIFLGNSIAQMHTARLILLVQWNLLSNTAILSKM